MYNSLIILEIFRNSKYNYTEANIYLDRYKYNFWKLQLIRKKLTSNYLFFFQQKTNEFRAKFLEKSNRAILKLKQHNNKTKKIFHKIFREKRMKVNDNIIPSQRTNQSWKKQTIVKLIKVIIKNLLKKSNQIINTYRKTPLKVMLKKMSN